MPNVFAVFLRALDGVRERQINRVKDFLEAGWRINPDKHECRVDPTPERVWIRFTTEMITRDEPDGQED